MGDVRMVLSFRQSRKYLYMVQPFVLVIYLMSRQSQLLMTGRVTIRDVTRCYESAIRCEFIFRLIFIKL